MNCAGPALRLVLVLVEPSGPLNIGSVARLCANFGIAELRLVAPRCDPLAEEARRMAVHALPLLEAARVLPDLDSALADCRRVVATSGRGEGDPLPPVSCCEALSWLLQSGAAEEPGAAGEPVAGEVAGAAPLALVFGREDRGLSSDELLRAGRIVRIETDSAYASLNLSHAVAVVLHALHELRHAPAAAAASGPALQGAAEPCARQELEAALADARALLLEVGFLLPHTARARMAKLRALLQRAQVSQAEVALLRGMVCQLRWASRRPFASAEDH
ncbi:MAG: TrmH family RNA methyltransferase [Synechococcaceae cyanobacterium]|nr:TrmH family RNA methyltransferase [Synechococcaceae cyanobacterium]